MSSEMLDDEERLECLADLVVGMLENRHAGASRTSVEICNRFPDVALAAERACDERINPETR